MSTRKEREYDVEISAAVSADELTFHEAPEVRSRHWGRPRPEGTAGSDRSGVPRPVESGVAYEDVRVDYRLASRISPTGEQLGEYPDEQPEEEPEDGDEED